MLTPKQYERRFVGRIYGNISIDRPHITMEQVTEIVHQALMNERDRQYQDAFKNAPKDTPGWCPPCPACAGVMKPWDAWLVTGATCETCGWNMSEGSGCLG